MAELTKITITTSDLISIPRAAEELGVNFSTVYRWIRRGTVRPFRIGSQVYLTTSDLQAIKSKREVEP